MNRRRVATALLLMRQHNNGHQYWVHPINIKREECGEYHSLYKDLRNYPDQFYNPYGMATQSFNYILMQIQDCIYKPRLNFWPSICPEEKLAVCIRYLATSDSITTIAYNFRLGISTVCNIILSPTHIPLPTEEQWKYIADDFSTKWNIPNCMGAIDGKHVNIQAPANSGSLFYNYKSFFFSIILPGIASGECRFVIVDIGGYGSNSDSGLLNSTYFFKQLNGRN